MAPPGRAVGPAGVQEAGHLLLDKGVWGAGWGRQPKGGVVTLKQGVFDTKLVAT